MQSARAQQWPEWARGVAEVLRTNGGGWEAPMGLRCLRRWRGHLPIRGSRPDTNSGIIARAGGTDPRRSPRHERPCGYDFSSYRHLVLRAEVVAPCSQGLERTLATFSVLLAHRRAAALDSDLVHPLFLSARCEAARVCSSLWVLAMLFELKMAIVKSARDLDLGLARLEILAERWPRAGRHRAESSQEDATLKVVLRQPDGTHLCRA